jgi:hypothetical protein
MNLLVKLVVCPFVVYIADVLSPQINFALMWQILAIGWILAIISNIGDRLLLEKISILTLTWLDVIMFSLIIWLSSLFYTNAHITFSGSLFAGIILGFEEYLNHKYILASRKRQLI